MNRRHVPTIAALVAMICLCGCAGSMRARYADHLTNTVKPGDPDEIHAAGEEPYSPPATALSAVPDF